LQSIAANTLLPGLYEAEPTASRFLETDSGKLEEINLGLVYCTVADHAKLF